MTIVCFAHMQSPPSAFPPSLINNNTPPNPSYLFPPLFLPLFAFLRCFTMDVNECRRSAHIPAFGNWDLANQLPITQYFESATQAGLLRPTSSSAQSDRDLYALDSHVPPSLKKMRRKRTSDVNTKRQGKVWDVRPPPPGKPIGKSQRLPPPRRPKPVDQDLYQIPPELLRTSKRSKMLGFISNCLLPCGCVS